MKLDFLKSDFTVKEPPAGIKYSMRDLMYIMYLNYNITTI